MLWVAVYYKPLIILKALACWIQIQQDMATMYIKNSAEAN